MKNNIVFYIVVLCIGVVIGKMFNWGYFELKSEISIIEAITLFVTIGLALYVAKILEKEVQDTRVQKDLYISKFCEIDELLSSLELLVESDTPPYGKIINKIHICGVKHTSTIKMIEDSPIASKNLDKIKQCKAEIGKHIRKLRRLLTEVDSENIISNNVMKYSNARILEIHTKSNDLKNSILKLKILTNML
uniref:hypothetical protein n=1 Tax=uncultured Dysgonomonas sp. TaxID=206096 RepID=UPI0026327C07|nr:hypothetical protein [uncultured Dysgonomonas sp.]